MTAFAVAIAFIGFMFGIAYIAVSEKHEETTRIIACISSNGKWEQEHGWYGQPSCQLHKTTTP